jgi:hypothetical protein
MWSHKAAIFFSNWESRLKIELVLLSTPPVGMLINQSFYQQRGHTSTSSGTTWSYFKHSGASARPVIRKTTEPDN